MLRGRRGRNGADESFDKRNHANESIGTASNAVGRGKTFIEGTLPHFAGPLSTASDIRC